MVRRQYGQLGSIGVIEAFPLVLWKRLNWHLIKELGMRTWSCYSEVKCTIVGLYFDFFLLHRTVILFLSSSNLKFSYIYCFYFFFKKKTC